MALEISIAKKERDFYLYKVDESRKLTAIEERMKKVGTLSVPHLKSFCFIMKGGEEYILL